jgi:hypothetical protein
MKGMKVDPARSTADAGRYAAFDRLVRSLAGFLGDIAGETPKRALTRLADPVAIGPSLLWRAGNIRTPGTVSKVNLVLAGLPRFTAAGDDTRLLRGRSSPRASARWNVPTTPNTGGRPMNRSWRPPSRRSRIRRWSRVGGRVRVMTSSLSRRRTACGTGRETRRAGFGDLVVGTPTRTPQAGRIVTTRWSSPLDLERDYN